MTGKPILWASLDGAILAAVVHKDHLIDEARRHVD
jgi:hypothetical protein